MNGIITHYNAEKRYGFISTETDDDIFFHVTRMKNRQLIPEVGMRVSFNAIDSSKIEGKKEASDIVVLMGNNKFLHLGDLRIKFSNIKTYGIENESTSQLTRVASYSQEIEKHKNEIDKIQREKHHLDATIDSKANSKNPHPMAPTPTKRMIEGAKSRLREENYHIFQLYEEQVRELTSKIEGLEQRKRDFMDSTIYKLSQNNQMEYLYITTYQGDNYTFYKHDSEFDIYEKRNELDEHFA